MNFKCAFAKNLVIQTRVAAVKKNLVTPTRVAAGNKKNLVISTGVAAGNAAEGPAFLLALSKIRAALIAAALFAFPLAAQTVGAPLFFDAQRVGTTGKPQLTAPIFFSDTVTLGSINFLTQGAPNKDFEATPNRTVENLCQVGNTYTSDDDCVVDVTFKPTAAGTRSGAVVVTDNRGNTLTTVYLSGVGIGPQVGFDPGLITTIAGSLTAKTPGDGGRALSAAIATTSLALDGFSNIYFADIDTNTVRKISNGIVARFAGNGTPGLSGDGGPALNAEFAAVLPGFAVVAVDGAGNVFIADAGNSLIRRVDARTSIVTTVAGTYNTETVNTPNPGYNGDGIPAVQAQLNLPAGISVDASGNLYISDFFNRRLRRVDAVTGIITTVAGNGTAGHGGDGGPATSAQSTLDSAVAFDSAGNIYLIPEADIPDNLDCAVRKITISTGIISQVAGTGNYTCGYTGDGGPATAAQIGADGSLAVDAAGNLYFSDSQFSSTIRKVNAATGVITTFAGQFNPELDTQGNPLPVKPSSGDGGPANLAFFVQPFAIALDVNGNLFATDVQLIRKIAASPAPFKFPDTFVNQFSFSTPRSVQIVNTGNAPLQATTLTIPTNFAQQTAAGTNCSSSTLLTPAGECILQLAFSPLASGSFSQNATFTDNAPNSPQAIPLVGVADAIPTSTSLQASPTTAAFGTPVVLTVTIVSSFEGQSPSATGTVTFFLNGKTAIGTAPVALPNNSGSIGTASLTVSNLPIGADSITATYNGDSVYAPSTSRPVIVTITVPPITLTSINPNTATLGDPAKAVTFTGTGFTRTSVAQVNGNPIPTTVVNATTLTGVVPAIAFAACSTLQLTVTDPQFQLTTKALPLTCSVPPVQIVLTGPPTSPSGTQPSLNFQLTNPYPVPLGGIFTLAFTPDANLTDDPAIQFAGGGRTLTFSIPANSTITPSVQLQAGTVAGTITITLTVSAGGADVTPKGLQPIIIQVPPAPPVITSATMLQRNGNQLTVVIHGFSNTRELTTANFDFTAASGSIKNPSITVPDTTLFAQWYSSQPSDQFGSAFTYTQTFTLNDDATHIKAVSVTLVNSIGTSASGSAQ